MTDVYEDKHLEYLQKYARTSKPINKLIPKLSDTKMQSTT